MADPAGPNYSGGHWEAMTPAGTPFARDTSLMHGWSTWPVFLLPRYLGGLYPLEAGWREFAVEPVLAGVKWVEVGVETAAEGWRLGVVDGKGEWVMVRVVKIGEEREGSVEEEEKTGSKVMVEQGQDVTGWRKWLQCLGFLG